MIMTMTIYLISDTEHKFLQVTKTAMRLLKYIARKNAFETYMKAMTDKNVVSEVLFLLLYDKTVRLDASIVPVTALPGQVVEPPAMRKPEKGKKCRPLLNETGLKYLIGGNTPQLSEFNRI